MAIQQESGGLAEGSLNKSSMKEWAELITKHLSSFVERYGGCCY